MDKTYTFKCEIVNEDDEMVARSSTLFTYDSIKSFGDCEPIDEEVGKMLRRFWMRIEEKKAIEEAEKELSLTTF